MVGAPAREEEQARLTGARADFVTSLPRRLEILRSSLRKLEQGPRDPALLNGLLRRLHALGSASRVLGFASVAEALTECEKVLRRAPRPGPGPAELADVARALDLVPSLVLGAPAELRAALPEAGAETALGRIWPLSVLIYGAEGLVEAVKANASLEIECERTDDPTRARELTRVIGPDVVIIDADRQGARELVEQIVGDPLIEPVPLVAVGDFLTPELASSFVAAGASRVLPKPVSPETLVRTLFELHEQAPQARPLREPLGNVSVSELADRLAAELRRGLVEAAEPGARATNVALGEGADVMAAVWGAVARVRDLVTVRSGGLVRFDATGPEGAVPFAAWGLEERHAGERGTDAAPREAEGIPLQGRRIVVADDDPAVVWFLSGLLKAVGAEVLEAHDGEQALALTYDAWPDLVVSDVLMPKLDGFSLCHEIKRDVAVRDVPVILLSWKEDLLQRVRELGSDADGYLRKEAKASTVVERLREVLRPRARVEERLSSGGEVRGRLDGLTPRLVLELSCRGERDVRIGVRDAVYLYEVQVREGRLRSATRSASDGSFERGEDVLRALLGVSAGRFVVAPDASSCRSDFQGNLAAILRGPIVAARAAQRAVSAAQLVRAERVELEASQVHGYLECTPEPARGLLREIIAGASPRELVTSAKVGAGLLEAVLSDFARRGAVRSVTRDGGEVLLFDPAAPLPEPEAEPAAVEPAAVEPAPAIPAEPVPEPVPAPPIEQTEALPPVVAAIPTTTAVMEAPDLSDWELPPDFLSVLTSQPKPDLVTKSESPSQPIPVTKPSENLEDPGAGWTLQVEPSDAPAAVARAPEVAERSPKLPFSAEPTPGFARSEPPRGAFAAEVEIGTLRGVGPVPVRPVGPSSTAPALKPAPVPRRSAPIDVDSEDVLAAVLTEESPSPDLVEPVAGLGGASGPTSPEDALDIVLGVRPGLGQTLPLPMPKPPPGVRTEVLGTVALPDAPLPRFDSSPPQAEPTKKSQPPAAQVAVPRAESASKPPARDTSAGVVSSRTTSVPPSVSGGVGSFARTAAVALLAAAASFYLVRWLVWPVLNPPAAVPVVPSMAPLQPAVSLSDAVLPVPAAPAESAPAASDAAP